MQVIFTAPSKKATHRLSDEWAPQGRTRPEEKTSSKDDFPVVAISQVSKDGGSQHVTQGEDWKSNNEQREYWSSYFYHMYCSSPR